VDVALIENEKKRDKKSRDKKETNGIDVTDSALHHKTKKDRWITIQRPNCEQCKFFCKFSTGRTY